jgi:hemolysin III
VTGVDAGTVLEKPRLRGVFHQGALGLALVAGPLLVAGVNGAEARAAASIFAGSVILCFGASAVYHRGTWSPHVRVWLRRLDHTGIYLLIAGTYTPVSLFVLRGAWRPTILAIVWSGAFAAIVLKFVWVAAPKWLGALIGLALGWVGVVVFP